ncbi:MAG: DUF1738 domain-containing protein [Candidatus Omnitrophica bacterium]|nr:DUF1738 domain-containing protein [Candidatus Omnitrophota bacterium]
MKQFVYEILTEKIISALEKGLVPWRMPWVRPGSAMPVNHITRRAYSGINWLLLYSELVDKGYEQNEWLTFKQCTSRGSQIKKGERGTVVCYYSLREVDKKEKTNTAEKQLAPFIRYYWVFNVEQTTLALVNEAREETFCPITNAESIVMNMPRRPQIKKSRSASYRMSDDVVCIPRKELFSSASGYYATLFHELTHATGHENRLNRFKNNTSMQFGGEKYSFEELIAEIGACFLCAEAGIAQDILDNSAAYIKGWLTTFRNDKRFVVRAANRAQRAVNYILKEEKASYVHPKEAS